MKLRNENGAISIFVLVALLFMSAFLMIAYGSNINKSKVAKEQFDIISDIYSYTGGEEAAYDKAYTDLRKKNVKIFSFENEEDADKTIFQDTSTVELTKTFEGKMINYRIYGNIYGLGTLINNASDANNGKYKITIKLTNESNYTITKNVFLSTPLYQDDYIDYESKKVVKSTGTEDVDLPELQTFEDYTKIEVVTEVVPSKIELEYEGYTLD